MIIRKRIRLIGILLIPIVMISMLLVHMQPVLAATNCYGAPRTGTVYNDNGIVIKITGCEADSLFGSYDVLFYAENDTNKDICIQIRDFSVNGYMMDPTCSAEVSAGKKINDRIRLRTSDLESNGITAIQSIEFKFHIFNWDDVWAHIPSEIDTSVITVPFESSGETHKFGDWIVISEPTTYSTGTKTRTCTVCGYTETETIPKVEPDTGIQMLRLFNPYSGEHFYTSNAVEKEALVKSGWQYEGVAWTSPNSSNTPVFRLYNSNSGEHHYTVSAGEKDYLVDVGWDYEGIGWYSDDSQGVVLYRLYNPNATGQYAPGAHHYTRDMNEVKHLASLGWNYEGIGWYGL